MSLLHVRCCHGCFEVLECCLELWVSSLGHICFYGHASHGRGVYSVDQAESPPSPHVGCWVALVGIKCGREGWYLPWSWWGQVASCGVEMWWLHVSLWSSEGLEVGIACMGLVGVGGVLWCGEVAVRTWFRGSWILLSIWCSDLTVWAWFGGHGVGVFTSC